MATEIKVPTLGESLSEATVANWLKSVGDTVAKDEPLLELETDKVTIEVNAPAAGTLSEIRAATGAEVEVGNDWRVVLEPETNWCWRRKHFLTKWLMMHLHFVVDAGHLVDLCGVRACSINHHGRIEYFAASQCHASDGVA